MRVMYTAHNGWRCCFKEIRKMLKKLKLEILRYKKMHGGNRNKGQHRQKILELFVKCMVNDATEKEAGKIMFDFI